MVYLKFLCHEEQIYKYVTKNSVDKVAIGNIQFWITLDSFKMIEVDYDKLSKPCSVCKYGIKCEFRTYRALANQIDNLFSIECPERSVVSNFLDLKNWEFERDIAHVTMMNYKNSDPKNRVVLPG